MYTKNGRLHPRLTPTRNIIDQLKKTILHLLSGTYFPLIAGLENWFEIEKFITITAYFSDSHIFTIMTISLITYPGYDIINIIPLPTHIHDNIYTMMDTTYTTIAVRQDGNAYMTITYDEIAKCKRSGNIYVYPANYHSIYKINQDATCEIRMYS